MSHSLTLQLSDTAYERIQEEAASAGVNPEQLAVLLVEKGLAVRSPKTIETRRGVEAHFGEISLGYATGADNDSIDADLAREFAGDLIAGFKKH